MTRERVLVLGDVAVDVVVEADAIAVDDDRDAPIGLHLGGQAANVARWVAALGGDAGLLTQQLGDDVAGRLASDTLQQAGVEVVAAFDAARVPVVCSLVSGGRRTLLSDDGGLRYRPRAAWDELVAGGPGRLHVSGYALARTLDLTSFVAFVLEAVRRGWRISVDLSAVSVVERLGAAGCVDLLGRIGASAVFANDAEWAALGPDADRVTAARVIKHGADGCTFVPARDERGTSLHLEAVPAAVVDPTGAGDALAAGWLVGGPHLAMAAAARCVAVRGAFDADRVTTTEELGNE